MTKIRSKVVATLFAGAILSAAYSSAISAATESKGTATVDYGMMLGDSDRQKTEVEAMRNAVERWVADYSSADIPNYKKIKEDVDKHIKDYVLNYVVVDSGKANGQYSVTLRVEINEPLLRDKLLSVTQKTAEKHSEYMTFVFVAREQVAETIRMKKEAGQTKGVRENIAKERAEDSASQTKSVTQIIGMEKSATQYAPVVTWDITPTGEIDAAMGDVFTGAGYKVIGAGDLEEETEHKMDVERFKDDYRTGQDLKPKTRADALEGLRKLKDPVQYLAIGTLDIGKPRTDEHTGNIRVDVSVTGQVLAVLDRGSAVAKVGPDIESGEGPTALVARNEALKKASERVAQRLVAKLSSRNIR